MSDLEIEEAVAAEGRRLLAREAASWHAVLAERDRLTRELAAAKAREAGLREALEKIATEGLTHTAAYVARAALAQAAPASEQQT
jgi:hypothetical protein